MTHPAQLLKQHHIFAGKESGQNFLVNPLTAQMIIERAGIFDQTPVLEIGPGLGGLTLELAKKTRYVTAVEKDSRLVPILQEELDREEFTHVKIINQDILKADFPDLAQSVLSAADLDGGSPGKKMVVIGNLPYNISSQILFRLVEHRSCIETAFLMFQKELAQRIVSPPNSKDYSRLSAVVQYASQIQVVAGIKPACFFPRPKVDSTVLAFRFFQNSELNLPEEKMLFRMIKAAFSKRRKTIKNAMAGSASGFEKDFIETALNRAGIDPGCRAETLGVEQFIKLTKAVLALDREDPKIFRT